MNLFLLATFVYRFANGLLFLAVAWNLVRSSGGGAMALALSAIFGFLPAVVAAPLARRLLERVDICKLTLWGIAALCACALVFAPLLHMSQAVLAVNFMVLSIFFLLEGAWDALLAVIVNRLPSDRGDKLNSRQSAATQAGLMLGGLPLGLLIRHGGNETPFFAAAALYVVTLLLFALPALRRVTTSSERKLSQETNAGRTDTRDVQTRPLSWATLATLSLVWPCLTLVNMVMPLVANAQGQGTVEHAALLDASIGLGMACVGVAYEKLTFLPPRSQRHVIALVAAFIPLPFVALFTLAYQLPILCATFFLCGIGFGSLRVSVRKHLIVAQPAHRVGQIVASCNAYGFPILALLAFAYARSWELGPFVPLGAFCTIAIVGVAASLGTTTRDHLRGQSASDAG
ncbi:Major Facilitator Superfamily protein [Burkholderia sp. CF099]|nr:Major Facilitator Superfamily protein [Burkholderia sp. CF099]